DPRTEADRGDPPQASPGRASSLPAPELEEVDAADLAAEAEAEMEFLPLLGRDGYFVKGWSHLIAGYPRCGKTELVMACVPSWLAAGETVLYLAEEGRPIWRQRVHDRPVGSRGMRLVFALGREPAELLVRMRDGAESVVIIDTARNLRVLPDDENDNAA